jgi:hypothetical protein
MPMAPSGSSRTLKTWAGSRPHQIETDAPAVFDAVWLDDRRAAGSARRTSVTFGTGQLEIDVFLDRTLVSPS